VQFALRFDVNEDAPGDSSPPPPSSPEPDDEKTAEKVVSLDSFRKKP
jgi:hypothetical protein